MQIVVAVQAPIPDGTEPPVQLARIDVKVRLMDRLTEEQLAELETDLNNTLNLFVNTWGLS